MTYKLCKKLKDAGFKQDYSKGIIGSFAFVGNNIDNEMAYKPTLSELIKACGDIILWKNGEFWEAVSFNGGGESYIDDGFDISQECKTPEEAVAHLYLALNRDKTKE